MRRITTPTAEQDLFGTGLDGFTDGSAPAPPPTHLNADWFNQVQEEIARAVEGNGATLVAAGGDANYFQLDDAIGDMARVVAANSGADYVLEGLTFTTGTLSTTLSAGRFVQDGRRYVVTTAKLTTAGALSWGPLTASRDHYFYIAFENPGAPTSPPNRSTVYVVRQDVANGAAAPATPAGTLLFARLVTDATDITEAFYYNRGPRFMDEDGASCTLRPAGASPVSRAALLPSSSIVVDVGAEDSSDSVSSYFGRAYLQELRVKTTASSLYSFFENVRYTGVSVTSGGGANVQINIAAASSYPDGVCGYVEICGVAFNLDNPANGYIFRIVCAVIGDGATWSLDGSGGTPEFEEGANAIASTTGVSFTVSGANLRLELNAHATDDMRWAFEVHRFIVGD